MNTRPLKTRYYGDRKVPLNVRRYMKRIILFVVFITIATCASNTDIFASGDLPNLLATDGSSDAAFASMAKQVGQPFDKNAVCPKGFKIKLEADLADSLQKVRLCVSSDHDQELRFVQTPATGKAIRSANYSFVTQRVCDFSLWKFPGSTPVHWLEGGGARVEDFQANTFYKGPSDDVRMMVACQHIDGGTLFLIEFSDKGFHKN